MEETFRSRGPRARRAAATSLSRENCGSESVSDLHQVTYLLSVPLHQQQCSSRAKASLSIVPHSVTAVQIPPKLRYPRIKECQCSPTYLSSSHFTEMKIKDAEQQIKSQNSGQHSVQASFCTCLFHSHQLSVPCVPLLEPDSNQHPELKLLILYT